MHATDQQEESDSVSNGMAGAANFSSPPRNASASRAARVDDGRGPTRFSLVLQGVLSASLAFFLRLPSGPTLDDLCARRREAAGTRLIEDWPRNARHRRDWTAADAVRGDLPPGGGLPAFLRQFDLARLCADRRRADWTAGAAKGELPPGGGGGGLPAFLRQFDLGRLWADRRPHRTITAEGEAAAARLEKVGGEAECDLAQPSSSEEKKPSGVRANERVGSPAAPTPDGWGAFLKFLGIVPRVMPIEDSAGAKDGAGKETTLKGFLQHRDGVEVLSETEASSESRTLPLVELRRASTNTLMRECGIGKEEVEIVQDTAANPATSEPSADRPAPVKRVRTDSLLRELGIGVEKIGLIEIVDDEDNATPSSTVDLLSQLKRRSTDSLMAECGIGVGKIEVTNAAAAKSFDEQ